jgi:hypothetical protein
MRRKLEEPSRRVAVRRNRAGAGRGEHDIRDKRSR